MIAALLLAIPAGLAMAVAAARYAGRGRPTPFACVLLILLADLVALWAYGAGFDRPLWASLLLGWCLLALAAIDIETRRLPDPLTLPLIALGLIAAWLHDPDALLWHALGAAIGGGVFYTVGEAYFRLRGRDGLGLGDAKLLAALGAWVGLASLPGLVLVSAVSALLAITLGSLIRRRPLAAGSAISFGPFLAFGGWVSWLYGPILLA